MILQLLLYIWSYQCSLTDSITLKANNIKSLNGSACKFCIIQKLFNYYCVCCSIWCGIWGVFGGKVWINCGTTPDIIAITIKFRLASRFKKKKALDLAFMSALMPAFVHNRNASKYNLRSFIKNVSSTSTNNDLLCNKMCLPFNMDHNIQQSNLEKKYSVCIYCNWNLRLVVSDIST